MDGLRYGGVAKEEQEVVIRVDAHDRAASVNSTWPEWSRKVERMHGAPKTYQERDGFVTSAFWTLPLAVVGVRRVRKVLTPEQRQRMGDRLKKARSSGRGL